MEFDTGEGQRIRVVVDDEGAEVSVGLAFLPDGAMLITERAGQPADRPQRRARSAAGCRRTDWLLRG